MIDKIIEIKNVGHFVDYKLRGSNKWNGQFRKLNVIYAPNGSGKTTLATILKSLSLSNVELIKFKKTFGAEGDPKVVVKQVGKSELITGDSRTWSKNDLNIEVFDINYIEENLFAGSYVRKQTKTNLFRLLLGEKGKDYRQRIKAALHDRNRAQTIPKYKEGLKEYEDRLKVLLQEYEEYSEPIYESHIKAINKYLAKFSSYISLLSFSYERGSNEFEMFRLFPVFKVYDQQVEFSAPRDGKSSARYSLSEGDKSTIALCFFLGSLELKSYNDKIIVFDDPLSSFDYSRRTTTIHHLAKIADSSIQFFLLSHDLAFVNDFTDKCSFIDTITLKIESDGNSSFLTFHDLAAEFLTSTQKDIEVIKRYLVNGAFDEYERREVVRCIRPVLEGVFKAKYFDVIPNNVWLGDIIALVRKSDKLDRLYKLKEVIDDVIELNDYTKGFHHSSGRANDISVDSIELKRYVNTLMNVIDQV